MSSAHHIASAEQDAQFARVKAYQAKIGGVLATDANLDKSALPRNVFLKFLTHAMSELEEFVRVPRGYNGGAHALKMRVLDHFRRDIIADHELFARHADRTVASTAALRWWSSVYSWVTSKKTDAADSYLHEGFKTDLYQFLNRTINSIQSKPSQSVAATTAPAPGAPKPAPEASIHRFPNSSGNHRP